MEFVEICQGRNLSTDGKAGEIGTWPNDVDFEYDELHTDQVTAVYIKEELTLYVVGFVNSVKRLNKILHQSVEEELAEISKWRDSCRG